MSREKESLECRWVGNDRGAWWLTPQSPQTPTTDTRQMNSTFSSRTSRGGGASLSRVRTCPQARRSLVPPETECIDLITTRLSLAIFILRRPPGNGAHFATPLFEAQNLGNGVVFVPKSVPEPIALPMNWYTQLQFSSMRCRAPDMPPIVSQKRTTTTPARSCKGP